MKRRARPTLVALFAIIAFILPPHSSSAAAESADALRAQIAQHNAQIEAINKEIAQYEAQLTQVSGKKKTLQNVITQLTLSRKKVAASIGATKNKIGAIQLQIRDLTGNIADKQTLIAHDEAALGESIRTIDAAEREPIAVRFLGDTTLADVWKDTDEATTINGAFQDRMRQLSAEERALADAKREREDKQSQLTDQKKALTIQQGSLDAQKRAEGELLAQTKSQETAYQKLIAKKKAQEAAFEDALSDLKAKLEVAISPAQITPAGKGVLRWPLDSVRVTQYFGDTDFARGGGYNGKGHNGIDLSASIGTPVKAARAGTVVGAGNTDAVRGCYSFGKWVLVKHDNGLDTLYAHLSQVDVSQGQSVGTGDLLGYSGETGYATGPHLHFGVYVASAVQIMRLGDATNRKTPCSGAVMPIAPLGAYLNPTSYL